MVVAARSWAPAISAAQQHDLREALEHGRVVHTPSLGFAILDSERDLFDPMLLDHRAKNISFDGTTGRVSAMTTKGPEAARLAGMMVRFADSAASLVAALIPDYAGALRRGRTSFRPAEIAGRRSSALKDDSRLHVDAFPSQPLAGHRILRVFTNVDPSNRPRVWMIGEDFNAFAARFVGRIAPFRPWRAAALAGLGITKARRTAYDHVMLELHNAAKGDAGYRACAPRRVVPFPAGSSWLCFSDQVVHAATAGQFALEQTFYLPPTALAAPDAGPLACLERMMGSRLV